MKPRTIAQLIVGVLVVVAAIIAFWKFTPEKEIESMSWDKAAATVRQSRQPNSTDLKDPKNDIYKQFKAKTKKAGKDLYYVTIENIYCDAMPNRKKEPHYFRIGVTMQADTKKKAENIQKVQETIVNEVRGIMQNYPAQGLEKIYAMQKIKDNLRANLNIKLGPNTVQAVYMDEFISQ